MSVTVVVPELSGESAPVRSVREALDAVFFSVTVMMPWSPGMRTCGVTSKSLMVTVGSALTGRITRRAIAIPARMTYFGTTIMVIHPLFFCTFYRFVMMTRVIVLYLSYPEIPSQIITNMSKPTPFGVA